MISRERARDDSLATRHVFVTALIALSLLLTACGAEEDEHENGSTDAALFAELADMYWERVESRFPDATRPDVGTIRVVDLSEWEDALIECLQSHGVAAAHAPGPEGITYPHHENSPREEPTAIAVYMCNVQYPLDPKYTTPFTESQMRALYDYQSTTLTKCLVSEGIDVSPAPSFEVFVQNYGTEHHWSPYFDLGGAAVSAEQLYLAQEACPEIPDNIYDMTD